MDNIFSILHISDLHKPENSNLDNLFYSLQKDCDAYVKDCISKPKIIVVSGDLVKGAKVINAKDDMINIIKNIASKIFKYNYLCRV